jgi:hypothetical protein
MTDGDGFTAPKFMPAIVTMLAPEMAALGVFTCDTTGESNEKKVTDVPESDATSRISRGFPACNLVLEDNTLTVVADDHAVVPKSASPTKDAVGVLLT